jgi:hypothetical protein
VDILTDLPRLVMLLVFVAAVGVKVFAFVSALTFSEEAYSAAAKLTKIAWSAILGLAVLAQLVTSSPLGLLNLVGLVAALVFLADVRPALRSVSRR